MITRILHCLLLSLVAVLLASCGCSTRPCACEDETPGLSKFVETSFPGKKHARGYPGLETPRPGKPTLLLHEMPGFTPGTLDLALCLQDHGHKVYSPLFYGTYGQNMRFWPFFQMWFSGRWRFLSCTDAGPIRRDVDAMIDEIARRHPGRKITVIGNCLTGTLPFEALARDEVDTAIICQPALPFVIPGLEKGKDVWPLDHDAYLKSIEAMRDDKRKRVIIVQYAGDTLAPSERASGLATTLAKHGRAAQLDLLIGGKSDVEVAEKFPGPALAKRITRISVKDSTGHSTITGAPPCDRRGFRAALLQALKDKS